MKFTLRQLEGFIAAARLGSFTSAARKVAVTQPAFSQLIRELEAILGTRLFDRTTRKIALTEAGRQFLRSIDRPIDDLEQAYADARKIALGRRGRVVIGTLPSIAFGALAGCLAEFKRKNPEVAIRLVESGDPGLVESVIHREVDFGIGVLATPRSGLSFRELLRDELVALCPRSYELTKRKKVSWRELSKHTLILLYEQSSSRIAIERGFAMAGVTVEPAYEIANMVTSLSMVRAGLGVTIMPRIALPPLNTRGLQIKSIDDPVPIRQIGVLMRNDRQLPPAANAFLETLFSNHAN